MHLNGGLHQVPASRFLAVQRNAIILIDFIRHTAAKGLSLKDAVVEAGADAIAVIGVLFDVADPAAAARAFAGLFPA